MPRLLAAGLLASVLTAPLTAAHAAIAPDALVNQTTEKVLVALKDNKERLGSDPSFVYKLVDDLVLPHFDFEAMSRLVLGRYWNQASEAQRKSFVAAFRTLLVRTYAGSLNRYTDQQIVLLPLREDGKGEEVTVRSEIRQGGGPAIPIDYRMRRSGEQWKVFDVSVDGISLVTNYRSSFSQQIQRSGLDALIAQLETRNKDAGSR
ncbi:MAG: ABC transporter substrate-binding protein [Halothiobacillaceae bacterium]|jgi:phospholipid transport system substrate-binding protein|nr:ABC transporter substrate-binding protein [Halothiobacillaceae bacterium]